MKEACIVRFWFNFNCGWFLFILVHKWRGSLSALVSCASEIKVVTELVGHWRLSDDFGASCVLMPAIRTPIFRVKLKREIKNKSVSEWLDCRQTLWRQRSIDFNLFASSQKQIYDAQIICLQGIYNESSLIEPFGRAFHPTLRATVRNSPPSRAHWFSQSHLAYVERNERNVPRRSRLSFFIFSVASFSPDIDWHFSFIAMTFITLCIHVFERCVYGLWLNGHTSAHTRDTHTLQRLIHESQQPSPLFNLKCIFIAVVKIDNHATL